MNEASPSPVNPVLPDQNPPKKPVAKKGLILVGIVAAVIIVLIALAFIPVGGDSLWHRAYAVTQLRGVQVAEGFAETSQTYSFGMSGLKPYALGSDAPTGDYAAAGGTAAAVEAREEGASGQVYLLGDDGRALTDYPGRKAILDVSPDGTLVTFSVATSSDAFGKLSSWEVHLYDLGADTDTVLGQGFGGQFFERDGKTWLLYTGTDGLSVVETASLRGFTTTSFELRDSVSFMAKVSPDGKYLALRDAARSAWNVFEITSLAYNTPLKLLPLEADVSGFSDILLTPSAALGLSDENLEADGTETVMRLSLPDGNAKALYAFPADASYRFMQ